MNLLRTKPFHTIHNHDSGLKRCLSAFDLSLMGIGGIIGAGIFVLTGVAAAIKAGPAIILSYVIAGLACGFTAFSYAELAASIGGCGSAYGYAYAGLGEFIAWIIGWDLILEYGISVSTVAIGWSGYMINLLSAVGIHLPNALIKAPHEGGLIDLPAVIIILIISTLLAIGVHESARFNKMMVYVKLSAIALFIAIASMHIDFSHWKPFMPFGWSGIMSGAALIFFAYIGFDAVSTAAEEAIDPQRDLPIGIIASLVVCTIVYMIVSGLLTAVTHYTVLNVKSPVADVLLNMGYRFSASLIAVGAVAALTTVILVMYYALTRIFFAISRDGLLPPLFSHLNAKTKTPVRIIFLSGITMALISGFSEINEVAELVNIGTLAAFIIVSAGVIALRYTNPELQRPFKAPFSPWVPLLGIAFCLWLTLNLPWITWCRFITWMVIGLLIYAFYGYKNSLLAVTKKAGNR